MNKKRLGVGFIGGGFVAQFHIRSWIGVRDADVNGIYTKPVDQADEAIAVVKSLRIGHAKKFNSITEMVADPNIDAIWICSPNFTRMEVMEEIVNAVISGKGELIGVACEKPLGRNLAEAKKMLELAKKAHLLDGYLENQIFAPAVRRGKDIVWKRGATVTGRPYLARAAEEHAGPHMPWFWQGELQGGGVLNDMMCHSVECARYLLTPPGAARYAIEPLKLSAYTNCLKWQQDKYADSLQQMSSMLDYRNKPAEDFARSLIEYQDQNRNKLVVETTTSWCYVGAGLRLSMELLGPEYSMQINTLDTGLKCFFSREVAGKEGEDMIEKQNAEMGLMPVVPNEEMEYGYEGEDRHMVQCFLDGKRPEENFDDGVEVTRLLMAAYKSAEEDMIINLQKTSLDDFVPEVARGIWNPRK
jgi:predicted dehydrogenase